jgi:hypothetical protein
VVELWSVANRQFVVSKKILCLALCAMLLALRVSEFSLCVFEFFFPLERLWRNVIPRR